MLGLGLMVSWLALILVLLVCAFLVHALFF